MRNFHLLANNVDVSQIMNQLHCKPFLWDQHTIRTKHPNTAHGDVSDILVWFNALQMKFEENVIDDCETIPFIAWDQLPALRPIVFALMRQVEAVRLGRVIITKLPSGKVITPHTDGGSPSTYYTRYQIALQCLPGNVFISGDEQISFRTGQIWQVNNRVEHSVINNSEDDRIVCIVDLRLG